MPKHPRAGHRAASPHPEGDLAVNQTTDDFDSSTQRDDSRTPFSGVIGAFPMGTLSEVAGKERARRTVQRLERAERAQDSAVLRVLGRQSRR